MAQRATVLAIKVDSLDSMPRTQLLEGKELALASHPLTSVCVLSS